MLRTAIIGFIASFAIIAGTTHQDAQSDATETVDTATASFIVRADSLDAAAMAVDRVGGTVTDELGIIDSVVADVTEAQAAVLRLSQ